MSEAENLEICQKSVDDESVDPLPREFTKEKYGANYQEHLLEQYKLFVEMTDRISQRRAQANTFYTTILAGFLAVLSFIADKIPLSEMPALVVLAAGFTGVVICTAWGVNIYTHKQLNSGKFKVIHEMERELPYPCYDREWDFLERGTNLRKYCKLTRVELFIPVLLGLPYLILMLFGIFILSKDLLQSLQIILERAS